LAQTVPAEVIVVDDGSVDQSAAIIGSYGARFISVFKAAGGHVSAVNAGYAVATGDVCIFLDADDVLYSSCVETVLRRWRPSDVKLQYRLDTINAEGVDQRMPFPHFPADLTPEAVRAQAVRFGVYPWTVSSGNAYSRTLLDALLPIDAETVYRSPDGYLNKMAPLFGNVRSIPDVLGAYRVHGANAWAQAGGGLRLSPIVRWLKFDQVLQSQFEAEAARRGFAVTPYAQIRTTQQMEHRLLAYRFAPGEFDQPGATAVRLFAMGVSAAWIAPNISWAGRFVWIGWMFILAFLPKPVVRWVFGLARGQTGRSAMSRLLVGLSRGAAAPGSSES
jgi:glycosyltransferase involved in cell wall biosynthesis